MKGKSLAITAAGAVALVAGIGIAFFGSPGFPGSSNESESLSGKLYVSATWRGEFTNYNSYVFELSKKEAASAKSREFDQFSKEVSKFSFPNGYIVQEFCEYENRRFVVGGRFWTSPNALGTWRLYELTSVSGAIVPRLVDSTSDYRFRDCSFWTAHGKTYLAAVTQWDGYLHLWNVTDRTSEIRHVPYYGKANNKVTTMHFVDFADLNGDGHDEVYLTATTPEFWRFGNSTGYQEGTLFAWEIGKDGRLGEVKDVGGLTEAFVKRVKTLKIGNSDVVLVGREGVLSEDGQTKTPFAIYAYYGNENGIPKHRKVLEIRNKECKEFTDFWPFWPNVPSFQLGCDNGETFLYEIRGDSPENFEFFERAKIELNQKVTEEYASQRDALYFWDVVQTHSLFGTDFDGDGRDELLIWVNNTGLYKVSVDDAGKISTSELFHIKRVFPEPVGRLMIFAITDEPPETGLPSEPLIPYSPRK